MSIAISGWSQSSRLTVLLNLIGLVAYLFSTSPAFCSEQLPLLKEGGTIYLVYSNGTTEQKKILQEELKKDLMCNFDPVDLSSKESDAHNIYTCLKRKLDNIEDNESVGLNYTGGTKAMAVHAYKTIQELSKDKKPVFSYLDSRRLKMCIDRLNNASDYIDIPNIDISIDKLFNLHGLYLLTNFPPSQQPILIPLAEEIAKAYLLPYNKNKEETPFDELFKSWCYRPWNKDYDWTPKAPELDKKLTKYIKYANRKLEITVEAKNEGFKQYYDEKGDDNFRDWLLGFWLENLVLSKLFQQSDQLSQLNIKKETLGMSLNVSTDKSRRDTVDKKQDAKFELDIIFIKNYQLFAISCTTKTKKADCKAKLFEALSRGKELGGDEARVALVCCHHNPSKIEKEVERFQFKDVKVKVFGLKDLADIGEKIVQWVEDVEKEAKKP